MKQTVTVTLYTNRDGIAQGDKLMHIMTKDGWKALSPRVITPAGHTPSMLEVMGIDHTYNGPKAMAEYANSSGHGYYFHYNADGTHSVRNV